MHRRTARTNHLLLVLVGLVLLAGGGYLIVRHLDLLGHGQPADSAVYSPAEARWLHQNDWVWIAAAVVVVLIGLIALRWLLVQPRLDRIRTLRIDRDLDAAGHTRMAADVLTDVIEDDVAGYPGIVKARAMLIGAVDAPEIILRVQARPLADFGRAYARIVGEALPAARTALDSPHVPAQIHLVISGRLASERDEHGYRPQETVRQLPAGDDAALPALDAARPAPDAGPTRAD